MKKINRIGAIISLTLLMNSCVSNAIDQYPKSDMAKNAEDTQKKLEAEREKTKINPLNNFGKPNSN